MQPGPLAGGVRPDGFGGVAPLELGEGRFLPEIRRQLVGPEGDPDAPAREQRLQRRQRFASPLRVAVRVLGRPRLRGLAAAVRAVEAGTSASCLDDGRPADAAQFALSPDQPEDRGPDDGAGHDDGPGDDEQPCDARVHSASPVEGEPRR
jgi:hypothetical protein